MLKTVSSITNAIGALNYKGTWNASTNTPTLASGVGTKGDYYVVSVAGTTSLDGISNWGVGDWATFNGSVWQRVEGGADGNFVNVSATGVATLATAKTTLNAPIIASESQQTFGATDFIGQNSSSTKTLFTLPSTSSCSGFMFLSAESANGTRGSDIFYFHFANDVFTATALAANGVGSFATTMALVGNDVQVTFTYTSGLGGAVRFFASGFANVCTV